MVSFQLTQIDRPFIYFDNRHLILLNNKRQIDPKTSLQFEAKSPANMNALDIEVTVDKRKKEIEQDRK